MAQVPGGSYVKGLTSLLEGSVHHIFVSLRRDKTFISQGLAASHLGRACLTEAAPGLALDPRARTPRPPRLSLSVPADGCHAGVRPWRTRSVSREARIYELSLLN